MKYRKGLAESLESYAYRMGLPPDRVRAAWRAHGLNRLTRHTQPLEQWVRWGCGDHPFRVLPNGVVPTSNGRCIIEET